MNDRLKRGWWIGALAIAVLAMGFTVAGRSFRLIRETTRLLDKKQADIETLRSLDRRVRPGEVARRRFEEQVKLEGKGDVNAELDSLKFLSYYDSEGRAVVLPVVQATSAGSDRIALVATPFGSELKKIPDGAKASILCLNLKMESVLVKGIYRKGVLEVERVYNSMPPKMEYVYPRSETIEPVRSF